MVSCCTLSAPLGRLELVDDDGGAGEDAGHGADDDHVTRASLLIHQLLSISKKISPPEAGERCGRLFSELDFQGHLMLQLDQNGQVVFVSS